MELFDAIKNRHCYRGGFKDIPVKKEDLIKILEAGLMAPSGKNAQTTEFVVITESDLVSKIHAMHDTNKAMQQAKAYIVCIVDKNPAAVYEGISFQIEDCSAAIENIFLALTALGYATVWIDGWLRVEKRAEKIAEIINLPSSKKIQVILPIGIPSESFSSPKKKPFTERVFFNNYTKVGL